MIEWREFDITTEFKRSLWDQVRILLENIEVISCERIPLVFLTNYSLVRLRVKSGRLVEPIFLLEDASELFEITGETRRFIKYRSSNQGQLLLDSSLTKLNMANIKYYIQLYYMARGQCALMSDIVSLHGLETKLNWDGSSLGPRLSRCFSADEGISMNVPVWSCGELHFMDIHVSTSGIVTEPLKRIYTSLAKQEGTIYFPIRSDRVFQRQSAKILPNSTELIAECFKRMSYSSNGALLRRVFEKSRIAVRLCLRHEGHAEFESQSNLLIISVTSYNIVADPEFYFHLAFGMRLADQYFLGYNLNFSDVDEAAKIFHVRISDAIQYALTVLSDLENCFSKPIFDSFIHWAKLEELYAGLNGSRHDWHKSYVEVYRATPLRLQEINTL